MSYLYGLIVVALFGAVIHYFTELKTSQKIAAGLAMLLIILGAVAYNEMADAQAQHVRDVQLRYEQGKTVRCEGIDVNRSGFSFSVGTYTFIGREKTEHYGRMFKAERCE